MTFKAAEILRLSKRLSTAFFWNGVKAVKRYEHFAHEYFISTGVT